MKPGSVLLVTGLMGAGKGLALQYFAHRYRQWYVPYSNYDSCWIRLENIHELISIQHGLILLDEIDFMMHSRSFSSQLNIAFALWMKIQRKRANCVIIATQNPYYVDVAVRRVARTLVHCERRGNTTLLNFLETFDGEMYRFRSRAAFCHSRYLYNSYDTTDTRVVLSMEPGGRATSPDFSVLVRGGRDKKVADERYEQQVISVARKGK